MYAVRNEAIGPTLIQITKRLPSSRRSTNQPVTYFEHFLKSFN